MGEQLQQTAALLAVQSAWRDRAPCLMPGHLFETAVLSALVPQQMSPGPWLLAVDWPDEESALTSLALQQPPALLWKAAVMALVVSEQMRVQC